MANSTSFNLGKATSSDLTNAQADITIDAQNTDGATGQRETEYQITNWKTWFGYYIKIPELKQAIDMRAIWTVGKGFKTKDARTQVILDRMRGWGEDTFNDIIKNMVRTKRICGDAFAEIVKDEKGNLINIKPLDPSTIKIIVDKKGMLKRYEQVSKVSGKLIKTFKPLNMLHLINKRVADEIHGRSDIEAIEEIILANNELFFDVKKLMHRHVKPIMAFKLNTDDQTKIDAFVAKMDAVVARGENIYIPKGSVEFELVAVPSNATLNPLPWRNHLKDYFFQVCGIPQIILGSSGEFTESTAKIAYLAFQQSVEDEQREIEDQIWRQLFLKVKFDFPASLRNEILSMQDDEAKDGANAGLNMQPSDATVSMEGKG